MWVISFLAYFPCLFGLTSNLLITEKEKPGYVHKIIERIESLIIDLDGFTWQELKAASTSQSREEAIANITEADKDKDKKVNSAGKSFK